MVTKLIAALVVAFMIQQAPPATTATATDTAKAAIGQATTPADCLKAVRSFVGKRQQEVRLPTGYTSEILKQVDVEKNALAATCVSKFEKSGDLAGLAELYSEAGQPEKAKKTLTDALAASGQPAEARAATLGTAVSLTLREPKGDERNAYLEKLVDQLDTLPAAVFDRKLGAHSQLMGYYRGDDIDAGIIKHATWIIEASKSFTPEQRQRFSSAVVSSHVDMAEAWAGQGMNDQAIALLKRAKTDWADVPRMAERVDPEIARLELVGTPGAVLTAPRWLNMPAGKTELDLKGSVTLLEFSAWWCGPCKESYPGVNRLRQRFGPQGFQVVLATQLYGYFETEKDLAPEAEFDRDRTYFAHYGLDVPIAVGDQTKREMVNGQPVFTRDKNDERYRVGGIPQIHLIDKKGVIRLVMVGYDDANEEKLAKMIEAMLKEK